MARASEGTHQHGQRLEAPNSSHINVRESSVVSSVGNVGIHNCPNRGAAKGFLLKSCELARNEATWGSQRLSVIHTDSGV